MPQLSWIPKQKTALDLIAEEKAKIALRRLEMNLPPEEEVPALQQPVPWRPMSQPAEAPTPEPVMPPMFERPQIQPQIEQPIAPTTVTTPTLPEPKEEPISLPFWQRALQVFAAPFNWVDETIIKPGLALAGTAAGLVPEVARQPGEDFWEWKKRSWAELKTPGIDINVPWSDEPWRIDVKGVLEFIPWLLIPGAGQVGTGARAARGIAGIVGKIAKPLGYAIEYSPWGFVEKTAGVAIKGGVRVVGSISSRVSTAVGEKLFGKYVPPPVPAEVTKLTAHFKETVMPGYRAFQKAKPALRARQEARLQAMEASYRRGEIPIEKIQAERDIARAGGIKAEYALTPEALAARQEKAIAEVEAKVVSGEYTESVGKALITKLRKSPAFTAARVTPEVAEIGIPKEYQVYQGIGKGRESLWFSTNPNEALKYARKQTEGKRGVEPLIRVWDKRDIEKRIGPQARLSDLKQEWATTQYSYTELNKIPYKELSLSEFSQAIPLSEEGLAILKELKVAIPKAEIGLTFTTEEVKKLHDMMNDAFQNGLVEAESKDAFMDLMFGQLKTLPEKHNLLQWKAVFGDDFAKAVGSLGSPSRANQVIDALGISKSMVSMADMSGFGRQGLFFVLLHPMKAPGWFVRYGKSFLSEKLTLDMDDALRARPIAKIFQQGKTPGYLRPVREAPLALREEAYPAMADRIPFLRRSGRSFNAGLNEMSLDTFEAGYNAMVAQGATEAQIDLWRGFINLAGGRGTLPKGLEKYAPALNLVVFSPRLQAATLQLPRQLGRMLFSGNPYMRKEAAKALITFVGGGSAILGLLKATGNKVEIDPRSGDFGKIRIGETRLDIWRGYIQYARFATQLLMGERKSAYGNMNKAERGEIAGRFIQSKMSPVAGLISDIWRGENFRGEPLFDNTTGFSKIAKDRFLPLAVQDIIDAMEQNGVNGALIAAPAFLGIGALTYVNDFVRVKEKIARELGFESWDDIDPKTQREIQNRNAELQAATIAFDRQVMGTAWGDWRLAGNAIEDNFRVMVDQAVAQYKQTKDGVKFRKKISDAWTARRGGYDARNRMPQFEDIVRRQDTKDTAEALISLGPEQLAIKVYIDAMFGDDMYDEFGDYRFDEAEIRRGYLVKQMGQEMVDYVEEYRNVRYETYPPEFQELIKAKIVMKPYWEVRDKVIRQLGEPRTPYQQRRVDALISKVRKQLRRAYPEIEKYYQQFYVNQSL